MASVVKRTWTTKRGEAKTGWRVQFYVGKVKRFRQFPTERKAKRFLESVGTERVKVAKQLQLDDSETLAEVAEQWLKARQYGTDGNPPLEPTTVQWYRGLLDNHILPALGQSLVRSLTRSDVKAFRTRLLSSSVPGEASTAASSSVSAAAARAVSSRPLAASRSSASTSGYSSLSRQTAKKILTTLRSILGHALEEEILQRDPSERVTVRHSKRGTRSVEIHEVSEMTRIVQTACEMRQGEDPREVSSWSRYYPFLLILVYCGMRLSEVRGLDCKDVDLARRVIHVRQRADRTGRLGAPKSAKGIREIHFPGLLEPELARMIDGRQQGLVFRTRGGRPVDAANFRKRAWKNVQAKASVRCLTIHSCRHFFASRQIAQGVHPKELSAVLGHADEGFTLRVYGHLFKDRETELKRRDRAEASVLV